MDGGSVVSDEAGNELESAVVRFAGDSGDGIQLTGTQFTQATAMARNDLATFPDFPAEIRAPAGTTFGVSAFQIHFGSAHDPDLGRRGRRSRRHESCRAQDQPGRPAQRRPGHCRYRAPSRRAISARPGLPRNPLEDGTLEGYRFWRSNLDMTRMTVEAVKPFGLGNKDAQRCKNMWALGLVDWLFGRDPTINEGVAEAEVRPQARHCRREHRGAQRRTRLRRNRRHGARIRQFRGAAGGYRTGHLPKR